MEKIVEYLKKHNKTISTMESATGGYIASSITNIKSSSQVFKFGAVTYSNQYKIKMGVSPGVISKFSVYSLECANNMSLNISLFTNSDYGVSVTGKLNDIDPDNEVGLNNIVYLSIYDKSLNKYYNKTIRVKEQSRVLNKDLIKEEFIKLFYENIIKE